MERWLSTVMEIEGVGSLLITSMIDTLGMQSVRWITDRLFADDGALLASTRSCAEHALISYQQVSKDFGLTVRQSV